MPIVVQNQGSATKRGCGLEDDTGDSTVDDPSHAGRSTNITADQFRHLALALPACVEGAHMQHPDFRIGGKIFATLAPDEQSAMVKLDPADQTLLVRAGPAVWQPAAGAWGRQGATMVRLAGADAGQVARALERAWRRTAAPRFLHLLQQD